MSKFLVLAILCYCLALGSLATDKLYGADLLVPSQFATIQTAIEAAAAQVEEGSIGQGGEWGVKKGDRGVVRFESTPPGATVFVDGALQCPATPCDAELSRRHRI